MAKKTVESSLALDVLDFARADHLYEGSRGTHTWKHRGGKEHSTSWKVTGQALLLTYELTTPSSVEPTPYAYPVTLAHTPTCFGGVRVGFLCPGCQARVRKLYLPPGEVRFLCRGCHHLTYESRRRRRTALEKDLAQATGFLPTLRDPQTQVRKWRETHTKTSEVLARLRATDHAADLGQALGALTETEPEVPPAPVKRPRGRPKRKRPYERTRPFTESKKVSEGQALCLRCRAFRELTHPVAVILPNGRPARQGVCPCCGARMSEITKGSEP